ncbi:hypothetical protein BCR44DRAFT_1458625 [Catenaria anguillulae PL171]|uniref:Uncharacterized protein n=1 Tax=Catenaria anguillulae PL171 TaxID=765915 RepID=A0A1Y2HXF9_9FUNG|nr:hypothetical protein BCR44DRAFT_1458625 [Catenaria anguillulae PL171]
MDALRNGILVSVAGPRVRPEPSTATRHPGPQLYRHANATPPLGTMLSPDTAARMHHLVGHRTRASKSSATSTFGSAKRRHDTDHADDDHYSTGANSFMDTMNSIGRTALLEYGSVYHSPGVATSRGGSGYAGSIMGMTTPVRSARVSGGRSAGKRSRMSTGSNASVASSSSVSMSRDIAPLRAEIDSLREQLRKAESDRFLMQSKYDRDVLELEQRVSEKDGLEYKIQRNAIYEQHQLIKAQFNDVSEQLAKAKPFATFCSMQEQGSALDTTVKTNTENSQTRIRHLETQLRNQNTTADRTEKMLKHALAQSDAEVKKLQEANLALAKTNLDLTTQLNTAQSSLDTITSNYVEERRKTLLAPRVEAQRKEARDHLAYAQELEAENQRLKVALQRMAVDEKRLASRRQRPPAEVDELKRQIERLQATLRKRTESVESLQAQVDALKIQLAASAAAASRAEEMSFKDEVEYFRGRVNELMAGIMANGGEGGAGDKARPPRRSRGGNKLSASCGPRLRKQRAGPTNWSSS